MNKSGTVKELALILRTIRHGESSLIATVFGLNIGKMAVLAKGARGGKPGAMGGVLDPPSLAELVIYRKPGRSVQILGQATVADGFAEIKLDLALTAYAAVISELVYRGFTDGEVNSGVFQAALSSLKSFDGQLGEPQMVLWDFLLSLAEALGFGFDPIACPVCGKSPAETGAVNRVWLDAGGITCGKCSIPNGEAISVSGEAVGILRLLVRRAGGSAKLRISPNARREITTALFRHLEHHHPAYRSLHSLKILEALA